MLKSRQQNQPTQAYLNNLNEYKAIYQTLTQLNQSTETQEQLEGLITKVDRYKQLFGIMNAQKLNKKEHNTTINPYKLSLSDIESMKAEFKSRLKLIPTTPSHQTIPPVDVEQPLVTNPSSAISASIVEAIGEPATTDNPSHPQIQVNLTDIPSDSSSTAPMGTTTVVEPGSTIEEVHIPVSIDLNPATSTSTASNEEANTEPATLSDTTNHLTQVNLNVIPRDPIPTSTNPVTAAEASSTNAKTSTTHTRRNAIARAPIIRAASSTVLNASSDETTSNKRTSSIPSKQPKPEPEPNTSTSTATDTSSQQEEQATGSAKEHKDDKKTPTKTPAPQKAKEAFSSAWVLDLMCSDGFIAAEGFILAVGVVALCLTGFFPAVVAGAAADVLMGGGVVAAVGVLSLAASFTCRFFNQSPDGKGKKASLDKDTENTKVPGMNATAV